MMEWAGLWKSVRVRESGTFLALILISTVLTFGSPHFLTISNLVNVLQQSTIIAVIAAGMTLVIISRGIDLSVGSIVALSGLMAADVLHAQAPVAVAVAAGLGAGFVCGLFNGLLTSYALLPPFIATLGTMGVVRGAALMYAGGGSISGFSDEFRVLAEGTILGIPAPVAVMIVVYILGHALLTQSRLGRYAYAIGGNEEAAVLAGINVRLTKTLLYGICGLLSGLAAILLTARLNSAQSVAGTMYELDAIAAVVLGGTSLMGGVGTMLGTMLGSLIMGVLRNGLNLLDVSSYIQQVVIGSVIIAAVLVDVVLKRSRPFRFMKG